MNMRLELCWMRLFTYETIDQKIKGLRLTWISQVNMKMKIPQKISGDKAVEYFHALDYDIAKWRVKST